MNTLPPADRKLLPHLLVRREDAHVEDHDGDQEFPAGEAQGADDRGASEGEGGEDKGEGAREAGTDPREGGEPVSLTGSSCGTTIFCARTTHTAQG